MTAVLGSTVGTVTVSWTAPVWAGTSSISSYQVLVFAGSATTPTTTVTGIASTARTYSVTGLTRGLSYTFQVRAVNGSGNGALSPATAAVTVPLTVPGAPTIGTATSGAAGGAVTATIAWTAPTDTGGSPITGYRVVGERITVSGSTTTVVSTTTVDVAADQRSYAMTFPSSGRVRFKVIAINGTGISAASAYSSGTITAQ